MGLLDPGEGMAKATNVDIGISGMHGVDTRVDVIGAEVKGIE
jgi:hypothetical protein